MTTTTAPAPTGTPVRAIYHDELVEGADQGFAAWMVYAPDGTVHAGPIASDRDHAALMKDLNAPPTADEIAAMRAKTRTQQGLHPDDLALLALVRPLPKTGVLGPDDRPFTAGPITHVHEVGDIVVVEYRQDLSHLSPVSGRVDHGTTRYQPYVQDRRLGTVCRSLDSALVEAIAYKRVGLNSQAAQHFDLVTLGTVPDQD